MSNCYICGTKFPNMTSTNTRCWSCARKQDAVDSLVRVEPKIDKDERIAYLEETRVSDDLLNKLASSAWNLRDYEEHEQAEKILSKRNELTNDQPEGGEG